MIDEHWIVVERSTDRAIFETWNPELVAAIDKTRYDTPTVYEYLVALNRRIRREMKPDKVIYGSMDGNPTVLAEYPSGRMKAMEYSGGEWRDVHPANVATKASIVANLPPNVDEPDLTLD